MKNNYLIRVYDAVCFFGDFLSMFGSVLIRFMGVAALSGYLYLFHSIAFDNLLIQLVLAAWALSPLFRYLNNKIIKQLIYEKILNQ